MSRSTSFVPPAQGVDHVVGALNTVMFGLLIHFGSIWMIEHSIETFTSEIITYESTAFTLQSLILHQYWIFLQHANVLANPSLQHLDREYGIALLRRNHHWSIAATLSSYWCREVLSMFLCLPYLHSTNMRHVRNDGTCENVVDSCDQNGYSDFGRASSFSRTQYLILYSILYHTMKSRGVRNDAIQQYSSRFGIMRLVIDKFYHDTLAEMGVSISRIFLQGMDTFIHFCIVKDLISYCNQIKPAKLMLSMSLMSSVHLLFIVWVIHAAVNQLLRCSTASAIVHCFYTLTTKQSYSTDEHHHCTQQQKGKKCLRERVELDDDTGYSAFCSSSMSESSTRDTKIIRNNFEHDEKYIVRKLLHCDRIPEHMKGRKGLVSACVDKTIRIQTAASLLAVFFVLGLGQVPLGILTVNVSPEYYFEESHQFMSLRQRIIIALLYGWLFWSLLYGVWAFFLKSWIVVKDKTHHFYNKRKKSVINLIDLAVMITIASSVTPSQFKSNIWWICACITIKSFIQEMQNSIPNLFRRFLVMTEFTVKTMLVRLLMISSTDNYDLILLTSILTFIWFVWVVSNPTPTPCEASPTAASVADVVFLGHPAELADAWALWLLPYSLKERWKPPFWAFLLWPLHYVVGLYVCKFRRKLYGEQASFFCCDDFLMREIRMQNWVSTHFARHFVSHPSDTRENIIAAARHAEKIGVKVMCLGALNKAESINGGGIGVVEALGPHRRLSVIHGNHLTAATVIETIYQCYGDQKMKFFLTGASSKVGWAVAQALKERFGYQVLCHSTDSERRNFFKKNGFAAARTLAEGAAFSRHWIVGKYDMAVVQHIPQNSIAIVFSVPHPLSTRLDVRVIEAGILHLDLERLDRPRVFVNKLKENEIFACHAAGAVAAYRLKTHGMSRIDEVGPVNTDDMDNWLIDAKNLGFRVPQFDPVHFADRTQIFSPSNPLVVIVGAGSAGLCAAADLNQKQIPHLILEAQENPEVFGSWNELSKMGLEITTQKRWCNLPGFPMSDVDFPKEYISPSEYQRYLKMYSNRFSLNILRGAKVVSIVKETGSTQRSWILEYYEAGKDELQKISAWSVIVATGKHSAPQNISRHDLIGEIVASEIPIVHSTEMCGPVNWNMAIQAACKGALCIVGFGNSAADLSTVILEKCHENNHLDMTQPKIHIATRTVPPVFPRKVGILRVDTVGYLIRKMPNFLQEKLIRLLWLFIPSSRQSNAAFPIHLKRWNEIKGRVPIIDKHGMIAFGFQTGQIVGHGPIIHVTDKKEIIFCDQPSSRVSIDMIILATGYIEHCIVVREERINGLYKCGFGNDRFLPLRSICDDAEEIVNEVANAYHSHWSKNIHKSTCL